MKLTNNIVEKAAKELGFYEVGFSKADELIDETAELKKWLDNNYQASMAYMENNFDKRKDVKQILPTAKSIISLIINYYKPDEYSNLKDLGKVSRYAWGRDYHYIVWEKLDLVINKLKEVDKEFECKSYIDTGPVMDKAWAVKSGVGWMGKHSNIINREIGSWFFIANIITNQEFNYSKPIGDYCGNCTACIEACPTEAIVEDYVVDANKCISYLTIENKGEINKQFSDKFDDWIFGCDVCQDVCPWNNKFSVFTDVPEFQLTTNKEIDLNEFDEMTNSIFKKKYSDSPIFRARTKGMRRNANFLKERKQNEI